MYLGKYNLYMHACNKLHDCVTVYWVPTFDTHEYTGFRWASVRMHVTVLLTIYISYLYMKGI